MTHTISKFNLKNVIIYIGGCIFIALGVVMMLRSDLGISSWDTLHYSLHRLTGITVGTATILVAVLFTLFVTVLNKHFRYFLMAIPIILVGTMIDLFNLIVFVNFLYRL